MPLNGSGGVSQPASSIYPAAASTLIESAKFNISIADIYSILASALYKDGQQVATQRIPFAAGVQTDTVTEKTADTGVTLDSVLLKDGRLDTTQGADITCAATLVLETATGNVVDVTGSTGPVTAITLSQGHWRFVRFTGTPTLTHGASLVLPGAADIVVEAGDYALFVGYASSVVRCAMYLPAAYRPKRPVLATEQATTSGTSKDFTSIPSWVKKITVMLVGVSTNGTDAIMVQIGDSGGVETSGYRGNSLVSTPAVNAWGAGALVTNTLAAASAVVDGVVTLTLEDASDNTWAISANGAESTSGSFVSIGVGTKALSAVLDRVRVTTTGGTQTFDAGAVNILYE